MVSKFELLVERTLYTYMVKQINNAWENGIKYHVLGFGSPMTLYPCVSFFCGDDPCQHRISGLQEGSTGHGCVYCLFPTTKGIVYDPAVHLPRNVDEISRCCSIAEKFASMEMGNEAREHPDAEQKRAIDILRKQNVHAHENPFHHVAMGYSNNIFKANPPDILHLFCAGLMKSLTQWVLTIILQVNSQSKSSMSKTL